ncbi:hypothetical protein FRC03_004625 [Tulasnella sp. 419]|nr:hypothetical protein FRC03_004625 [Tulasnella sp. 419]
MERAVLAYHEEQIRPSGTHPKGLHKVAADFDVSFRTLQCRIKGTGLSMKEFAESRQNLPPEMEAELLELILENADWAVPMDGAQVREYAEQGKAEGCYQFGQELVPELCYLSLPETLNTLEPTTFQCKNK